MNSNRTVMLIDDSAIDNFISSKTIQQTGFANNILVYENGQIALNYLKACGRKNISICPVPDLILLDLNMPVMNGDEFLREFSKLSKEIREKSIIIVLTSTANPANLMLSIKNPFVKSFLSKPLIPKNIEDLILEFFSEENSQSIIKEITLCV